MLKVKNTPISVGATALVPYSDGLAASLSYISTYGDVVRLYKQVGNSMHIPMGLANLDDLDPANDHRARGKPQPLITPALKARNADQQQVVDASLAYLKAGVNHIVEAPTGFGKTWVGITLGLQMNVPVLIIVTKEDLVHGWRKTLLNSPTDAEPGMGLDPSTVGHLQADVTDWKGKRFVIGMVHSLIRPGKYPSEVWAHFGMTIFDEVHRMGADTFQEACYLVQSIYRLGLSATPDRKDGKDRVFHAHIGPVMVKGTSIPMKPKILVKQTNWRIPDGMPYSPARLMGVLGIMAKSTARNMLILEFVLASYKAGRTTVLMSDLVDGHLHLLFKLLTQNGVDGADIGFYIGQNTADKQLAKVNLDHAKRKRVVLATYGMTKEGTDVPEWDTLVLCTPKSDVKQAIGRVMRMKTGKKQPVVLDLVDGSKIFQTYHQSRLKQYFSVGAEVVRM